MDIDVIIQATKSDFYYQKYSVDTCEFGKMKIIGVEQIKKLRSKNIKQIGISDVFINDKNFLQIWPKAEASLILKNNHRSDIFFKDPYLLPLYVKEHYAKKIK